MTTIMVVDDHPMVRNGLRTALNSEVGWTVVGEAADGNAALEIVAQLRPDVLVIDLQMPGMNGIEVLAHVREHAPETVVVLFSMHAEDAYVRRALTAGAAGYVLKDADAAELLQAIKMALEGRRYLSKALTDRAISAYFSTESTGTAQDWRELLTARERQICLLAAQGLSNQEIADRLNISPRTAETHRGNFMRKLDLKSQAELLRYAHEHQLLP
jgi:DNA-binding NarL/FixJ family response regulator